MTQSKYRNIPLPLPLPLRSLVLGVIPAAALCFAGCLGEQLSLFDLECKTKSDCVIKDVPMCTGCNSEADQTKVSTCVPADYEPPSKINCRTSSKEICAGWKQINGCECKHMDFGDEPAPDLLCWGSAADAGVL